LIRFDEIRIPNEAEKDNNKDVRLRYYKIEINKEIAEKMEAKRYIKFLSLERERIGDDDHLALRIFQYISMRRFGDMNGREALSTLATVIPLQTFVMQKKKNAEGNEVEYKVSIQAKIKKRIEESFKYLIKKKCLTSFETEYFEGEKEWYFIYTFNSEDTIFVSNLIEKKGKQTEPVELATKVEEPTNKKEKVAKKSFSEEVKNLFQLIPEIHQTETNKTQLDNLLKRYDIKIVEISIKYINGLNNKIENYCDYLYSVIKNEWYLKEMQKEEKINIAKAKEDLKQKKEEELRTQRREEIIKQEKAAEIDRIRRSIITDIVSKLKDKEFFRSTAFEYADKYNIRMPESILIEVFFKGVFREQYKGKTFKHNGIEYLIIDDETLIKDDKLYRKTQNDIVNLYNSKKNIEIKEVKTVKEVKKPDIDEKSAEIARNLIKNGVSIDIVALSTGLTKEQLLSLIWNNCI